jgi:hypothetical protein
MEKHRRNKKRNDFIYITDDNYFEFVLYRNTDEMLVCSREFPLDADLLTYEKKDGTSNRDIFDAKELIDDLLGVNENTGIISGFLKKESKNYSWAWHNPYLDKYEINRHEADFNAKEKEQFIFELRKVNLHRNSDGKFYKKDVGGGIKQFVRNPNYPHRPIVSGALDANLFPKKVRHFVDIKPVIPDVMGTIKEYLTRK